eukprot:Nk52_evm62s221 gene=Nk52_evmTU62s221
MDFTAKKETKRVIRTVSAGCSLPMCHVDEQKKTWLPILAKCTKAIAATVKSLEEAGFEVQTSRILTNPFEEYMPEDGMVEAAVVVDEIMNDLDFQLMNVGPAKTVKAIDQVPAMLKATKTIYASIAVPSPYEDENAFDISMAASAATIAVAKNGDTESFKLCSSFNMVPGSPFYPAGYHSHGPISIAVGGQNADMVYEAFADAKADFDKNGGNTIMKAQKKLKALFDFEYKKIENIVIESAKSQGIEYGGIDCSIVPCVGDGMRTIVEGYETLGLASFGEYSTITISGLLTNVCKSIDVKRCGYSGLMLPILEDKLLAKYFSDGKFTVRNILINSTVCGCGLDCVPIPGDTSVKALSNLFIDTAALAFKLKKPLSARIFPVMGVKAGDRTTFNSPYLFNCTVPSL